MEASVRACAEFEFSRSSGPGGQNVNKLNTKVTARVRLDRIAGLSVAEKLAAAARLARRMTSGGELVVQVQEERSQAENREIAVRRLASLLARAARIAPVRVPTRPTRASKERRLAWKSARARTKKDRRAPSDLP